MPAGAGPAHFEVQDLPGGAQLVTVPLAGRASVALAFMLGVGSRYEAAEDSGISHFVEHMLFKGSERYPSARSISETIEGVGGIIDAATDRESTAFWTRVPAAELERGLAVLADMLVRPLLAEEDVVKERHVVIEELRMYQDSPQDHAQTVFDEVMWPGHPLGRDIAGSEETVRGFTPERCRAHMTEHVRPDALVVSVAGAVDGPAVRDLLERQLGEWLAPPPQQRPAPLPATEPDGDAHRLVRRQVEQASVILGARAPSYLHPDRFVVDILNVVLGEGMSSRLFLELRERRGLVYDVHSFVNRVRDSGVFGVGFGTEPRRAATALRAAVTELRRLAERAPEENEMHKAREYAKGRLLLHLEGTSALCEYAGQQLLLTGGILPPEEIQRRYDEVSGADVQRAAAAVLGAGLRLAVVGPFRSPDRFSAALS